MTDAEWRVIEPLLPPACPLGRPRLWSMREILYGIFHVMRGGIAWRLLPTDLPPKSAVYGYFRAWRDSGLLASINHHLVMLNREQAGREASPSAVVLDSQNANRQKRRPAGLRRGQEGEGAQASGPGAHGQPRSGARPATGQHSRSRRSRTATQAVAPLLSVHRQSLRRRGICRRQAGECDPHRHRDRSQAARTGRLRGPPTSMSCGKLLRLDQPQQKALEGSEGYSLPPPRPSSTPLSS